MLLYILITIYLMFNCFLAGQDSRSFRGMSRLDWLTMIGTILFGAVYYLVLFLIYFLKLVMENVLHETRIGFLFLVHVCKRYRDPEVIDWDRLDQIVKTRKEKGLTIKQATWAINYLKKTS